MNLDKWKWKAIRDPLSGIGHLKCAEVIMVTDLHFDLCREIADAHNIALEELQDEILTT
jgi:hypothetical protein